MRRPLLNQGAVKRAGSGWPRQRPKRLEGDKGYSRRWCYRCCSNPPEEKTFPNFGKMRCQSQQGGDIRYYRCRARDLGYTCEQRGVPIGTIDDQVVSILMQLKPPEN